MNSRRGTITFWLAVVLVTTVAVAVVCMAKYRPRTVPWDECSELYRQYSDVPGVKATFVKDYPVNDTVSVDVTLLQATDSAGWERLICDFNIHALDEIEQYIDAGQDITTIRLIPEDMNDTTNTNKHVLAISFLNKSICIFHTSDRAQRDAVRMYNYDKSTN